MFAVYCPNTKHIHMPTRQVWEEADRRGLAGGEKSGYGTAEGTREVCRFMVSKLGDEYSAYLGPLEVRACVRVYVLCPCMGLCFWGGLGVVDGCKGRFKAV